MKKHRTTHTAEPKDGKVMVSCETCGWRDWVSVKELSYWEAIAAIFKARDEHEANPEKDKQS